MQADSKHERILNMPLRQGSAALRHIDPVMRQYKHQTKSEDRTMTTTSPRTTSRILTGLALAATVAISGLMINTADASTRVNQQSFNMSKARMLSMCTSQRARIYCSATGVSCGCDNGYYYFSWQQNNRVLRSPSPTRTSASVLGGGEDGGGRGGRGGKP